MWLYAESAKISTRQDTSHIAAFSYYQSLIDLGEKSHLTGLPAYYLAVRVL